MWTIYKYANEDIKDSEGCIIYKKDTWYEIGTYDDLDAVKSILEHEIYLYNVTCNSETPLPRFEVVSNFHKESD